MRDLKVTIVQANQIWEDKEANFDNYTRLLVDVDTDLILLPEMFNTCFSMNTSLSEKMDGRSISWLKDIARKKNAAIYTSLMISNKDGFYNRGVFVHPDGKIDHYDKRKTFGLAGENKYFNKGKKETIVNFKGWKFQLQICYDLRFPEIVRNAIKNDSPKYDVILYVANWPQKRISQWESLLQARAIENQSYVIAVNRIGEDNNGHLYNGKSMLIDALGEKKISPTIETTLTYTINKTSLMNIRERLPFLIDR